MHHCQHHVNAVDDQIFTKAQHYNPIILQAAISTDSSSAKET
jgi:hypothetical protein